MDESLSGKKKSSWWEKRTRYEKCLIVLTGLCIIVIIYLASNLLMRFPASTEHLKKDVCMTEKCIRSASSILEKMDRTVDPCDDFYKFACGNFVEKQIIPDHKTMVSSFGETSDKVSLQLLKVFEEDIHEKDPHSLRLVKSIYKSCMNTSQIENEGLSFMKREFRDLGGWPVIEPNWNEKTFDWKNLLFRLKRIGWRRTFFLSMFIDTDLKNSSKRIFTISQPCMPYDRYKKGFNDTAVKAGYEYLVELAVLFGADRTAARAEMREVVEFQIELAKMIIPYEERKNVSLSYNPVTIRELQRNFTTIPWLKLINNYLSPIMLTSDTVVNVAVPTFLERLENFLPTVKKRVLANYMFTRLVVASTTHLPEEFRKKDLDFVRTVYGQKEATPRWKECIWQANRLHIAVSSIYVKKYVNKTTKYRVAELTIDIKSSFIETLKKIGWMDKKTKKHALQKAEKMSSFIGYPDELLDVNKVEDYYRGLEVDPKQYSLRVSFNISNFAHMKYVQLLREPVLKPDWRDQAYSHFVNAFYDQTTNSIELPAAILQDSFFDPDRPQYMNYGAIGGVIGHEITHGFDDIGRQYDKDGNVIDWWEPETNKTFASKSQCLVEQYGNYTIPEIEMSLNGVKNLGENIADNGGIKIAYRGYMKWLERNKVELGLPGLPYSPRQLFWISSAINFCSKYKKERLKQLVTLGHHAPNYFRVVVPFMNSDHFGRDFNCPLGSPMNPKYKCRVW
ncbi:neprilysin-2 [Tribolium castaneum]|uniref:Membrane metallo-endopeptidase-like 1 n=1 Tax=Tribolium castaneum TaxID=7070 RepID=D6WNX8_TRICA|nr:PREDICTED: membrane metallo-endopeptidase-like 1 [Tribolium castaneum]EFA04401.2 Membrane metallo-endopeptidase-like 1 [Tribolium castaneum]|eukprot:XP_974542.2 PREDICTED: membrane metallo-endopeptidase-like 1 [Tribolium castaneum]